MKSLIFHSSVDSEYALNMKYESLKVSQPAAADGSGIESSGDSMGQLITESRCLESKRSNRNLLCKVNNTQRDYSTELYEAIEEFFDKIGVFIVSPTPRRSTFQVSSRGVTSTKKLDGFDSNEKEIFPQGPLLLTNLSKGPHLSKVSASTLIQRRKNLDLWNNESSVQKLTVI